MQLEEFIKKFKVFKMHFKDFYLNNWKFMLLKLSINIKYNPYWFLEIYDTISKK